MNEMSTQSAASAPRAVFDIDLSQPQDNLLILKITLSQKEQEEKNKPDAIYKRVRGCWRLNPQKAQQADYVLAVAEGVILGVYKARRWLSTDRLPREYFDYGWQYDYIKRGESGRFGFEGSEADSEAQCRYLHKRITALPEGKNSPAMH